MGQGMSHLDAIRQIGINLLPLAQAIWGNGRRAIKRNEVVSKGKRPIKKNRIRFVTQQIDLEGSRRWKLLSPARRRNCINHARSRFTV